LHRWPTIEPNKNRLLMGAGGVVALVAIISFVSWYRESNQIEAGEALTQTLVNLTQNETQAQVADAYLGIAAEHPNTQAGGRALLEGATALFLQGKYTDAQSYFQQFLDSHPDDELSGQAALGVAKCLEAEGKADQAAGQYQHVMQDFPDSGAVITAKFALAQINMASHKYADAGRLFQEVAQAAPYSTMASEAQQYLFELRSQAPAESAAKAPAAPGGSLKLNQ
jgi:TolA-binding protein